MHGDSVEECGCMVMCYSVALYAMAECTSEGVQCAAVQHPILM